MEAAAAIKGGQLIALGLEPGPAVGVALAVGGELERDLGPESTLEMLGKVIADPEAYTEDVQLGVVATAIVDQRTVRASFVPREAPAPWTSFGADLDDAAQQQMRNAVDLPVSVAGALMPDAHVGYGLPIGGVLATDNVVIPYAVGVDIACRMRLTVFDLPAATIEAQHDRLCKVLERETLFGTGAQFGTPHDHAVMDEDWTISDVVKRVREKAGWQLGSSGSGNHYVEFGTLSLEHDALGLPAGRYLALVSHSGSRGAGAQIAGHYSKVAEQQHPELPAELRRLAWLDLDSEPGQEYWSAMELMGLYAAANHELIHHKIARALKADVPLSIENHHNFAWKERHGDRELIVHRKGATPAADGVLGVIPGSMATPGFVVRGKGNSESLRSASHGAGRAMSRTQARNTFRWAHVRPQLEEAKVTLLSAGLDEVPGAYKDIHQVMAAQTELVETIARFDPRIVKMADAGEKPED